MDLQTIKKTLIDISLLFLLTLLLGLSKPRLSGVSDYYSQALGLQLLVLIIAFFGLVLSPSRASRMLIIISTTLVLLGVFQQAVVAADAPVLTRTEAGVRVYSVNYKSAMFAIVIASFVITLYAIARSRAKFYNERVDCIRRWVSNILSTPLTAIMCCAVTIIIPLAIGAGGSHFAFGGIQLAELCKLSYILAASIILNANYNRHNSTTINLVVQRRSWLNSFWWLWVFTAVCVGAFLVQDELGTALVIVITAITISVIFTADRAEFYKSASILILLVAVVIGIMLCLAYLIGVDRISNIFGKISYRFSPMFDFMDNVSMLHKNGNGASDQQYQGLMAISSGGLWGWFTEYYIPVINSHNDMAFSLTVQLFGLAGGIAVILGYSVISLIGNYITNRISNYQFKAIALGASTMLLSQSFLQIAGNISAFPLIGNNLPFLSEGGSSLLVSMILIGILIVENTRTEEEQSEKGKTWLDT